MILESHEIWVLNVVSCYLFFLSLQVFLLSSVSRKIVSRLRFVFTGGWKNLGTLYIHLTAVHEFSWESAGLLSGRSRVQTLAGPTPWPDQHPGQTNTLARPTPWPDQHPGRTNTLARPTPWPDQHPGRTNTLAGPTPWPDQHPGQTSTLAGPTPWPDQHLGSLNN